MRTLVFKESDISASNNKGSECDNAYRTMDEKIDGWLITLINISASKKLELN